MLILCRYLLDASSGPFLRREVALSTVATGCVTYIRMSLKLIDTAQEERNTITAIVEGLHGLHVYASATWLDHLHDLATCPGAELFAANNVLALLIREMHQRATMLGFENGRPSEALSARYQHRLDAFSGLPSLHAIAQAVWTDEQRLQVSQNFGTKGKISIRVPLLIHMMC
jgi:hypothetical protein